MSAARTFAQYSRSAMDCATSHISGTTSSPAWPKAAFSATLSSVQSSGAGGGDGTTVASRSTLHPQPDSECQTSGGTLGNYRRRPRAIEVSSRYGRGYD